MGDNIDRMEYYTIASTGNGTDAGNLSSAYNSMSYTNGDSRNKVHGGYGDSGAIQLAEYNDFSTSANASSFGYISSASTTGSAACASSRCVLHVPGNNENRLEYTNPAAATGGWISTDFGNLTNPRSNATATSDGTTGEWYGGNDNVGGGHFSINYIDKITIASASDSTDIGDLLESNRAPGSTSGT